MSHYAAGTRFEHKTIGDLEENGYVIIRAAGSKGGSKVDIAAMKPGQLLFIQCKRSGALPPAEWDRVYEVAGWVGAIPLLAANGPKGRGVTYTRLLGPKIPRARTQPCRPFLLDEIAAAGDDNYDCGICEFLPTVNGTVRATQRGCPVHGEPRPAVAPYLPAAAAPEVLTAVDPHPDCQHEWHGADGGRCPGCGCDAVPIPTEPAPPVDLGLPAVAPYLPAAATPEGTTDITLPGLVAVR